MLNFLPALLCNQWYEKCLSYIGTEGVHVTEVTPLENNCLAAALVTAVTAPRLPAGLEAQPGVVAPAAAHFATLPWPSNGTRWRPATRTRCQ